MHAKNLQKNPKMCHQDLFRSKKAISWIFKSVSFTRQSNKKLKWKSCIHKCIMLTYKIMFQIFFVPKYFLVLKAVIFGTLLPEHPVCNCICLPFCYRQGPLVLNSTFNFLELYKLFWSTLRNIFFGCTF